MNAREAQRLAQEARDRKDEEATQRRKKIEEEMRAQEERRPRDVAKMVEAARDKVREAATAGDNSCRFEDVWAGYEGDMADELRAQGFRVAVEWKDGIESYVDHQGQAFRPSGTREPELVIGW